MSKINRRTFLQLMGGAAAMSTLQANIAKAQAIPANNAKGTIKDVEHIVILMQENRPFDHHFGTLRGVRGFNDPRSVNIHLPLQGGGSAPASVFLQPAGAANEAAGFSVPSGSVGGPANGVGVIPPFRVNPHSVSPGLTSLGLTYLPGTDHSWNNTHTAWDNGQYDGWASNSGPMAMSYFTRADIPYHYALADAFTVGDAYHSSIMGPTNPNRTYLWSGCVGNLSNLGPGGTDGHGAGPMTYNGLSINNAYWTFPTFPEVLTTAGVSWKIYQDLAGQTFAPDFGDGDGANSFDGNFTDNAVLYFNQYATAPTSSALFQDGCTGTEITKTMPSGGAPASQWLAWAESLFAQFRSDVQNGTLPQVSWIIAPAGYCEHADWPVNYGAWYISQVLDILVSNPQVFSETVLLINYDEADGSFDHILPPTPPQGPGYGASTVSTVNEIVTAAGEPSGFLPGPIGLNCRVPFLAISPWSKGGYVNSQVFDHTSTIRFIEKRFGVFEPNISAWRRAVCGDLTSMFNFTNPNDAPVSLPDTTGYLPPVAELAGGNTTTFVPTLNDVIIGVPAQEPGTRPAKALPYELNVYAAVSNGSITLTFYNTGAATAVFQVRSGNPTDVVRTYTVEPGKYLSDSWSFATSYNLSVYGPNGFIRYFNGRSGSGVAVLDVVIRYNIGNAAPIGWKITNIGANQAEVTVLDAYTGNSSTRLLHPNASLVDKLSKDQFYGWYDLIITVAEDPTFKYRLAGHVENGQDSFSDPAMGGLVTLKA